MCTCTEIIDKVKLDLVLNKCMVLSIENLKGREKAYMMHS